MPNDTIVRAPYNFVPFTTKILEYKDKIPAHNAVDPALKTGEIHVTLTAETPVFVSDGNKDNPHFFRGPGGAIQIPGSTIRGMVRKNMQILGFGLVRLGEDMQDQRVFYRKIADARGSTADRDKGGTQINGKKISYDPNFWKLPKDGEEKPVFYVHHNGHVFFGMSLYLRIGYQFSLKEGLPRSHRARQENAAFLDWPQAILGWAGKETSWRSRVSFGDFLAQGNPKELPLVTTVLSNPKISFYPGYVAEGKHYNQDDFQLRGYKQYWLKKDVNPASTNKEKVAVHLRPLPAGTKFAGVIRYKNLRPEELGLLLWSIRLEEGCYQSVGMGKPYGYGRMKVSIDELREFDLAAMYCPENLCVTPPAASPDAIQEYIDIYDAAAVVGMYLKKPSVTSLDELKDFFFLKRKIYDGDTDKVSYMDLSAYRNPGQPLPAAADFRKEAEEAAQAAAVAAAAKAPASEDDYSPEALAELFNSKRL